MYTVQKFLDKICLQVKTDRHPLNQNVGRHILANEGMELYDLSKESK